MSVYLLLQSSAKRFSLLLKTLTVQEFAAGSQEADPNSANGLKSISIVRLSIITSLIMNVITKFGVFW